MATTPKTEIVNLAKRLGFDGCRFTSADLPDDISNHLRQFIELGRHGDMDWMDKTLERRTSPKAMWPQAKSAIVLGMNYGPDHNPLETLQFKDRAAISVYAKHRDYHELIKGKLKQIAQKIAAQHDCMVKVFVDTAPLMEKPLAAKAGLGWQGKHTNLVSRELGSWLFIGVILTDRKLPQDAPEIDHCGTCTACLEICPTNAFPAPYQLDARRCISYLTIEYGGPVPVEFRQAMGNRVYGCDDCLAVCPWNKFAEVASEAKLIARVDLQTPDLADLASLNDQTFRKHFSGSPIKRIGRNRFLRNVLIAIGNSQNRDLVPSAGQHLTDGDPVVRGAAIWALSQLLDHDAFNAVKHRYMPQEQDETVLQEWQRK